MIPELGSELAKPGHPMSVVTDWSVDPDDWGEFLSVMFVEWPFSGFSFCNPSSASEILLIKSSISLTSSVLISIGILNASSEI